MKIEFKTSFLKAIKKIEDNQLKSSIVNTIKNVESSENVKQIINLKKLKGHKEYYRIRIGDYRIGIKIDAETVYFVEMDHRKNIYRLFPK